MAARVLLALAGVAAVWAVWLIVGGGVDVDLAGWRVRSNDPVRPLIVAALAFVGYAWLSGIEAIHNRWARRFDRIGDGRLAAIIAMATIAIGVAYSATAGIASDGYGYVSQADLWARGDLVIPQPAVAEAPWPDPEWSFAPLGYRPSQRDGSWALVPIYSAGLPMVMAVAKIAGGRELLYAVVPIFGGLLVWMTYLAGTRLGSSRAGLIACWLVATSPVMLLMLMQPMSDVPVAAAWTMAIVLALGPRSRTVSARAWRTDAALSGLASSLAILIRPNLAALAGVLAMWWLLRSDADGADRSWRHRLAAAALYSAGVLPGVLFTAALYRSLYGSAFTSGYGNVSAMFAWQHVVPNAALYFLWFRQSQGWLGVAGIVALVVPTRAVWPWVRHRPALWMILGCLSLVVVQYLAYWVFDSGLFLRFLLTCWPFIMLGVATLALRLFAVQRPVLSLLVSATIVAMGVQGLQHARTSYVFRQWHGHRRSVEVARIIAREFPAGSVFYAINHSGTVRYYGGRTTLRTDLLDPAWLDRSVDWLRGRGVASYAVLEEWEVDEFKRRYAGQRLAAELDGRLTLVYSPAANPVRLYDLSRADARSQPPRLVEIGNLHELRSAPPDPAAFAPQLFNK